MRWMVARALLVYLDSDPGDKGGIIRTKVFWGRCGVPAGTPYETLIYTLMRAMRFSWYGGLEMYCSSMAFTHRGQVGLDRQSSALKFALVIFNNRRFRPRYANKNAQRSQGNLFSCFFPDQPLCFIFRQCVVSSSFFHRLKYRSCCVGFQDMIRSEVKTDILIMLYI